MDDLDLQRRIDVLLARGCVSLTIARRLAGYQVAQDYRTAREYENPLGLIERIMIENAMMSPRVKYKNVTKNEAQKLYSESPASAKYGRGEARWHSSAAICVDGFASVGAQDQPRAANLVRRFAKS